MSNETPKPSLQEKADKVIMPESLNVLLDHSVKLVCTDGQTKYFGIYKGFEVYADKLKTRVYLKLEIGPNKIISIAFVQIRTWQAITNQERADQLRKAREEE